MPQGMDHIALVSPLGFRSFLCSCHKSGAGAMIASSPVLHRTGSIGSHYRVTTPVRAAGLQRSISGVQQRGEEHSSRRRRRGGAGCLGCARFVAAIKKCKTLEDLGNFSLIIIFLWLLLLPGAAAHVSKLYLREKENVD